MIWALFRLHVLFIWTSYVVCLEKGDGLESCLLLLVLALAIFEI